MKRCASLGIISILALLFVGCASQKMMVRPDTRPALTERPARSYDTFWDAVDNGDFEYAGKQQVSDGQKDLVRAMQQACAGNSDSAIAITQRVWTAETDSTTHRRSRDLLEELLSDRSRWQDVLELYRQDTVLVVKPEDDSRPLVKAFVNAPPEERTLPAAPDTVPLYFNSVGLPVVEVTVNGHPKRFILDTGAALTVLSSDFAAECGIKPADESIQAGTSNSRTVALWGAVADSMRWGKFVTHHHPVAVLDASSLRFRIFGLITLVRIDGIIGWNAIRELNLKINYRAKYVVMQAPAKHDYGKRNLFHLGEPMVVLTDEQGNPFNFLLDTGANVTALSNSILQKINAQNLKHRTSVIGGAGGMEKVKSAVVPQLTLYVSGYALDFKNVRSDPDTKKDGFHCDGTLGSDVGHRGAITVDYQNGYFAFEELKKQPH